MPKTYTSVPSVSTGDVYQASTYNTYTAQNVNNLIVPAACRVILSTSINPYTTGAAISWNSAPIDTDGMWSSGSATRITVQTTGLYAVSFSGETRGTSMTIGAPQIAIDGTNVTQSYFRALATGLSCIFQISGIFNVTAGSYFTFNVEHEGGSGYTVTGGSSIARANTRAEVTWIGRTS